MSGNDGDGISMKIRALYMSQWALNPLFRSFTYSQVMAAKYIKVFPE